MREVRRRFHEELRALEGEVQQTGRQAQLLLERALQALARGDPAVCDEVIRGDDEVDQLYLDIERRILGLFALQIPVASDLRLLTALLHVNLHLERIADQAVNLAKITKLAHGLPPNPTVQPAQAAYRRAADRRNGGMVFGVRVTRWAFLWLSP